MKRELNEALSALRKQLAESKLPPPRHGGRQYRLKEMHKGIAALTALAKNGGADKSSIARGNVGHDLIDLHFTLSSTPHEDGDEWHAALKPLSKAADDLGRALAYEKPDPEWVKKQAAALLPGVKQVAHAFGKAEKTYSDKDYERDEKKRQDDEEREKDIARAKEYGDIHLGDWPKHLDYDDDGGYTVRSLRLSKTANSGEYAHHPFAGLRVTAKVPDTGEGDIHVDGEFHAGYGASRDEYQKHVTHVAKSLQKKFPKARIVVGPRGGRYYLTKSGEKVYLDK